MCVSPGYRCAFCLARFNGNSWEEKFKCVLPLKSWTIILNNNYQLCVQGNCEIGGNFAVCIPITERLSSVWVANGFTLLKLQGMMLKDDLPEYVSRHFSSGIPVNWQVITKRWVEFSQRGDPGSFSWEEGDSFISSLSSSVLYTRKRRSISSGKDTRTKPKDASAQRVQPKESEKSVPKEAEKPSSKEPEKDSVVPDRSNRKTVSSKSTPLAWGASASPWLPAHKVMEINQWIDCAHTSSETLPDSDTDDDSRLRPPIAVSSKSANNVLTSRTKVQNQERRRNLGTVIPQSTPQGTVHNSGMQEVLHLWDNSLVASTVADESFVEKLNPESAKVSQSHAAKRDAKNNQASAASVNVQNSERNFVEPMQQPRRRSPKNATKNNARNSQLSDASTDERVGENRSDSEYQSCGEIPAGDVFCKPKNSSKKVESKKLHSLQLSTKNSEVPGSQMERMLSTSRKRRQKPPQRIERWRPVIGVDGELKVQGFLLLTNDTIAGQILTTNTVVVWGGSKVETCDGRCYELVGNPHARVPQDLKEFILSPVDCQDITARLRDIQALRDRADWGAEYEYFYGDMSRQRLADRTRSSNQMRDSKLTSVIGTKPANTQHVSSTQDTRSPVIGVSKRKQGKLGESPSRTLTCQSSESLINVSDYSGSPGQKSSQIVDLTDEGRSKEKESNEDRRERATSGSRANLSSRTLVSRNDVASTLRVDYPSKKNTGRNGSSTREHSDSRRSCFDNITWKVSQNQMMLPSPRLTSDSPMVDFSPSRIKVSYINPVPKSVESNALTPEKEPSALDSSTTSNEGTPKSRPSRSSMRRPLFTCCEDSPPSPCSEIPTPRQQRAHVQHTSLPPTQKRVVSPSPTRSPPYTRVLRSRTRRNISAPVIPSTKKTTLKEKSKPGTAATKTAKPISATAATKTAKPISATAATKTAKPISANAATKPPAAKQSEEVSTRSIQQRARNSASQIRVMVTRMNTKNLDLKRNKSPKDAVKRNMASPRVLRKNILPNLSKLGTQPNLKKKDVKPKVKKQTTAKKTSSSTKQAAAKKATRAKKKNIISSGEGSDENDDDASVCSNASDISIGPSASLILGVEDSPRRAPRTLRERQAQDEKIADMRKQLVAKDAAVDEDDPMAHILAATQFTSFPAEWCRHENFFNQNRKRRRPSSSDGAASPSRSGCDDGFGYDDATSSVATPQLLMRPPDPKQVQSYLQRQRAWNTKPQKPTRQTREDKETVDLPDMDYTAIFRCDSSDSDNSSLNDPTWGGD